MIQARRLLAVLADAALAAGSLGFGVVASGSLAGAELVRAAAGPRRPGLSATSGFRGISGPVFSPIAWPCGPCSCAS